MGGRDEESEEHGDLFAEMDPAARAAMEKQEAEIWLSSTPGAIYREAQQLDAQREEMAQKRNVIARSLEESGLKPPGRFSKKDSQELDEFLEKRDKVKKPRNIERDPNY